MFVKENPDRKKKKKKALKSVVVKISVNPETIAKLFFESSELFRIHLRRVNCLFCMEKC